MSDVSLHIVLALIALVSNTLLYRRVRTWDRS
jgi:hypothetical protein